MIDEAVQYNTVLTHYLLVGSVSYSEFFKSPAIAGFVYFCGVLPQCFAGLLLSIYTSRIVVSS